MVDILPFDTMNRASAYGLGELQVTAATYHQMDVCNGPLPFPDKTFDFVICRHTLEDLRDPIHVCREMNRVARAGYLETPSRLYESIRGVERPWYCGHYHHRWLVEVEGDRVVFQFKPHNLHSSRAFFFRRWPWQTVDARYANTWLLWHGSFAYEERIIIDRAEVKRNLREFRRRHRGLKLVRLRWRRGD